MGKTFEYVINSVGGFNKFQVFMICAVLGQQISAGWSMMQMAFAGIIPDFYCITNDTTETFLNNTATAAGANVNESHGIDFLKKCKVNGSVCIEYRFETSIQGIINEWDLVCDLSWVKATTTSVQMAGVLLGAVSSGYLGDLYGRKKTNYGFFLFHCICNVAIIFSSCWQMFMAFRFLIGMGVGSILVMCTPYVIEFVPENRRAFIPIIPMWPMGVSCFALAGYLLEDWLYLHLACALLGAPMLLGWFVVPESIRWLTVKGKAEEAYKVFEKMAAINGKTLPEDTRMVIQSVAEEEKKIQENGKTYSYIDIFRGPGMVFNTLSFAFMWMSLSMVGYGLAFGLSGLGGNVYLNLFLFSVLNEPAVLCTSFISNSMFLFASAMPTIFSLNHFPRKRLGRRKTTATFFFLGALIGFAAMTVELIESNKRILTVLSFAANCSTAAAWVTSVSWIIEIYPTVTRNLGYGFVNTCARIGGIAAPFAINLDSRLVLSYTLIGVVLLISAFLAILCRETKGMALADSITTNVSSITTHNGDASNMNINHVKGNTTSVIKVENFPTGTTSHPRHGSLQEERTDGERSQFSFNLKY